MTANDHRLDHRLFVDKKQVSLYRLAQTKYANLSGVGAATYPGRWNRAGQEAIYTSTEVGVPLLEKLVHTPKESIPSNLSIMRLDLMCEWGNETAEPYCRVFHEQTGGLLVLFETLDAARHAFQEQEALKILNPFAVALPSVIVPVWNVVLYPSGASFWQHIALQTIEPFRFDPRLFPEGASSKFPEGHEAQ